jgi:hypothetical protein
MFRGIEINFTAEDAKDAEENLLNKNSVSVGNICEMSVFDNFRKLLNSSASSAVKGFYE